MKTVFVTVGTTSFNELIVSLVTKEAIQALVDRGYTDLALQVGRGSFLPGPERCPGLKLEVFRFKDSISDYINKADLIISHAGAGSCLEALGAGKPLLVVVNDNLMDNHQLELAKQLHSDCHLLYCTCRYLATSKSSQPISERFFHFTLTQTLKTMDLSVLKTFLPGQPQNFANFLNKVTGLI